MTTGGRSEYSGFCSNLIIFARHTPSLRDVPVLLLNQPIILETAATIILFTIKVKIVKWGHCMAAYLELILILTERKELATCRCTSGEAC